MRCYKFAGLALLFLLLIGCQENTADFDDRFAEGLDTNLLILQDDAELLQESGVSVDSSYGIFSIGWNQFIRFDQSDATVSGHAMAAAFDELQTAPNRRRLAAALDMGDVTISYGSNSIALNRKNNRRHGSSNVYTLFHSRRDSGAVALEFIPDAVYTFTATGSDQFSALTTSITAPASLLDITSHSIGDTVSGSNDLTVTWSGGKIDAGIALRLTPRLDNSGRIFGGRHHFRPGQRPLPHQHAGSIIVRLENNPGSYTFSATDIADLLDQTDAAGLAVSIGQFEILDFDHDGRNYKTVMRNGDRVRLTIE